MTSTGFAIRFGLSSEPATDLGVVGASFEEELGRPYLARVDLARVGPDVELRSLLGQGCDLVVNRRGRDERLSGVVTRAREAFDARAGRLVLLEVEPALALLRHRRDSRIFQGRTVPQILEEILEPIFTRLGRTLELDLRGEHPPREYTVQYRETDLAFFHRLMEEEGLVYYFDHGAADAETLVVLDERRQHPEVVTDEGASLRYAAASGTHADDWEEGVRRFVRVRRAVGVGVTARSYDWTHPSTPFEERQSEAGALSTYVHDLPVTYGAYDRAYGSHDLPTQTRLHHERRVRDRAVFEGHATAIGLRAGHRLTLTHHPRPELDTEYLLTRVEHRFLGHAPADQQSIHESVFSCVPADVQWRPLLEHLRPRIGGALTATVVGPAGEEIHTDEHGRIKVQFHWDRLGSGDERSSCWIRVAQAMGGAGWGFSFIPRIGMEVAVSFVEGDPDRPLVVGATYNAENPPPYDYPADKTRTTIKTESSPRNGGYNELRFEDRAGAEEIYLQAEKDWNSDVKNDLFRQVIRDEQQKVGRDREREVERDEEILVGQDRQKKVGQDQVETVGQDRNKQVGRDEKVQITGQRTKAVGTDETAFVGKNASRTVAGNYEVTVGGDVSTQVVSTSKTTIGGNQTVSVGESASYKVTQSSKSRTGGAKQVKTGGSRETSTGGSFNDRTDTAMNRTTPSANESMGAARVILVNGMDDLHVGGSRVVKIEGAHSKTCLGEWDQLVQFDMLELCGEGSYSVDVPAGTSKVEAQKDLVALVADETHLVLKKNNDVYLIATTGDVRLEAKGTVRIEGEGGVNLQAAGGVSIQGSRVLLNAAGARAAANQLDTVTAGKILPAGSTVLIDSVPSARVGDDIVTADQRYPGQKGHIASGSTTVFIENKAAARVMDSCLPGGAGKAAAGKPSVQAPPDNQAGEPEVSALSSDGRLAGKEGGTGADYDVDVGNVTAESDALFDGTSLDIKNELTASVADASLAYQLPGGTSGALNAKLAEVTGKLNFFAGINDEQGGFFFEGAAGFTSAEIEGEISQAITALDLSPAARLLPDSVPAFKAYKDRLRRIGYKVTVKGGLKAPGSVSAGGKVGGVVDYAKGVATFVLGGDFAPVVGGAGIDIAIEAGDSLVTDPVQVVAARNVLIGG